jgi:hypothetical protein
MTFGASTPLQALVGAASGGLGTKSAGGTNLQALRNAAIGAAVPPAAEYGGQVLQKMMGVAPAAEEAAPLVERRSVPSRTTMSATEFNDALKNNRSMRTPFDYTEGARQTANDLGSEAAQRGRAAEIAKKYPVQSINPIRDPFAAPARAAEAPVSHNMIMDAEGKPDHLEIMKGDQPDKNMPAFPQGGHAGGGVSSVEELARPGQNYVVPQSGSPTYHGKSFAPESTPRGAAHVTVLPSGELRVNEGTLTPAMERSLRTALKAK